MLMQAFKSAADLGITKPQKEALMKTLVMLETGKLAHVPDANGQLLSRGPPRFDGLFSMYVVAQVQECGTICCIQGTAQLIGGVDFETTWPRNNRLENLFYPEEMNKYDIAPEQAATALRSYLTIGDARWDLAVA